MGPGKKAFHTLLATVSTPTYHTSLRPKTMSFRCPLRGPAQIEICAGSRASFQRRTVSPVAVELVELALAIPIFRIA